MNVKEFSVPFVMHSVAKGYWRSKGLLEEQRGAQSKDEGDCPEAKKADGHLGRCD